MTTVRLGTGLVTIDDIVALAHGHSKIEITKHVLDLLADARRVLDQVAASGARIYGLNTGLGAKVGFDLADDRSKPDPSAFQDMLVRGRSIGVGPTLSIEIVRAAIATRCSMLAQGGSGISVPVFQALAALLDAGVHPCVPCHGSLGEGDLGLMAHVALVLIGEGCARYEGEVLDGAQALQRAGLIPARLGPKDGLSLINASAVAVGHGALVAQAAQLLLDWQERAAALSFAAVQANRQIFEPSIQAARPAAGQTQSAARFRKLLTGSRYQAASLQDPLSFRCLAPTCGALADAVGRARAEVEGELNAAGDNPLVLPDENAAVSTGNFATPAFALAFENLGLAVAQAAQGSAARFIQLTGGKRAGLPRVLSPLEGAAAGFVPLQKTVMALMAELRRHVSPVMLNYWPVSEGIEDHATQSPLVVEKTEAILSAWRYLIAIELMGAAQAVDLQEDLSLGMSLLKLHTQIRERVSFLDVDRALGDDAQRLHDWILNDPAPG